MFHIEGAKKITSDHQTIEAVVCIKHTENVKKKKTELHRPHFCSHNTHGIDRLRFHFSLYTKMLDRLHGYFHRHESNTRTYSFHRMYTTQLKSEKNTHTFSVFQRKKRRRQCILWYRPRTHNTTSNTHTSHIQKNSYLRFSLSQCCFLCLNFSLQFICCFFLKSLVHSRIQFDFV